MFILPLPMFNVVMTNHNILKLLLNFYCIKFLEASFGIKIIRVISYYPRHVKQLPQAETVIYVPRIEVFGDEQRTHVILPDFLLPYHRYSIKTFSQLKLDDPAFFDVATLISKKFWDHNADLLTEATGTLKFRIDNIKRQYPNLRLDTYTSRLFNPSGNKTILFSPSLVNILGPYYIQSIENNTFIVPLRCVEDIYRLLLYSC